MCFCETMAQSGVDVMAIALYDALTCVALAMWERVAQLVEQLTFNQ
jgi:hypothetical protein